MSFYYITKSQYHNITLPFVLYYDTLLELHYHYNTLYYISIILLLLYHKLNPW